MASTRCTFISAPSRALDAVRGWHLIEAAPMYVGTRLENQPKGT
jgi:hypothetical protein